MDLTNLRLSLIIDTSAKVDNQSGWLPANENPSERLGEGSKMTAVIGQSFTTAKSGVTGIVQEIVENKNGTFRVRLDVNGAERWTTVK